MQCKKIFVLCLAVILLVSLISCTPKKEDDEKDPNNTGISVIEGNLLDSADAPLVKWEGRYAYAEGGENLPDKVNLYFTATGFTVDFYGTSFAVTFEHSGKDIYYNYAIDDMPLPNPNPTYRVKLPSGETTTTLHLATNLPQGHHTIKCLKMDEGYDGLTSVVSMETDGYFCYRDTEDDNANYKFLFVCASGGTGFGSLGFSSDSSKATRTTANSSSLHAFNYLTGRRFGADMQFVSCSGWGVKYPRSINAVLEYNGITPDNSVASARETGVYDVQKFVPDVIIFNIGGNDTGANGFDVTVYQREVIDMVTKLHTWYPNARMIWTHTNSNAGKYAVTAMTDAGLLNAGYMKVVVIPKVGAGDTGENTYGASNHNSFKTHLDTEKILVSAIQEWGYEPFVDSLRFEDFDWLLDRK